MYILLIKDKTKDARMLGGQSKLRFAVYCQDNKVPAWYIIKEINHAAPVVYKTVNNAHLRLPDSRLIAEMTPTQGK